MKLNQIQFHIINKNQYANARFDILCMRLSSYLQCVVIFITVQRT
jgi:hypothetical protein